MPRHVPSGCSLIYGRILIPPTVVEHHQQGFDSMIAEIHSAIPSHGLEDVLVAIEPRASIISQLNACSHQTKFDTRIVHPLTTKQYRLPADPGNKTDDRSLHHPSRDHQRLRPHRASHLMRFTGHSACWPITGGIWYARTPHCVIKLLRLLMFFCRDIPVSSTTSSTTRRHSPLPAVCSRPRKFARWAAKDWPRSSRSCKCVSTPHSEEDPGLGQWDRQHHRVF